MSDSYDRVDLLDHGYIRLVECWGSDERVVEAARMSTGKGFLGWGPHHTDECGRRPATEFSARCDCPPGDEKLLKFLWSHRHATPFEMAGAVFEIQAPIFVFREWHRHRTQSYNEMSARYTPLPDVNYIPSMERLLAGVSKTNRQAGTVAGANTLDEQHAEAFRMSCKYANDRAESLYRWALKVGVPKELARINLPVARYSRMRASANLRNWLAFLTLRSAPDAQWEIRQYADAVHRALAWSFPRTMEIFSSAQDA